MNAMFRSVLLVSANFCMLLTSPPLLQKASKGIPLTAITWSEHSDENLYLKNQNLTLTPFADSYLIRHIGVSSLHGR